MTSRVEKLKLDFDKPVSDMLVQARVFNLQLDVDVAVIAEVDPGINVTWNGTFEEDIGTCEQMEQPTAAIAARTIIAEETAALMEQCRDAVQEAYFYVGRAYQNSRAHLATYGKNDYERARGSHGKMELLMEKMIDRMPTDATALAAVGFTSAKITAFGNLYTSLQNKNSIHETRMGADQLVTETYYTAMNNLWAKMVRVNKAAMIAFKNSYAKRQMYLLYDGPGGDNAFTMVLPAGNVDVWHHFLYPFVSAQEITFTKLEGEADATVCFALAQDDPCTGTTLTLTELTQTVTYGSFNASGGVYMRARQTGPGEMRLRVIVHQPN